MKKTIELDGNIIELPVDGTKIGIDNLKDILTHIIKFKLKIEKYKADGKYTWLEKLGTAWAATKGIIDIFTNSAELAKEIKDLDQSEVHELAAYITTEFNLDPEKAKLFVEVGIFDTLDLFNRVAQYVKDLGEMFKKKQ